MPYNPEMHNRKSIRLKNYDYLQDGYYFVTICTQDRAILFGDLIDSNFKLNNTGIMIEKWCCELTNKFLNIKLDQYVIMPNHFHCIIIIGSDQCICTNYNNDEEGEHVGSPLHEIVQWFKTMTTNEYIKGVKNGIYPPCNKRIWQRNYYEHIIRNDQEFQEIRKYIINNPTIWELDKYYKAK